MASMTINLQIQLPEDVIGQVYRETAARAAGWDPASEDGPEAYITHELWTRLNTLYTQGLNMAIRDQQPRVVTPPVPRGRKPEPDGG